MDRILKGIMKYRQIDKAKMVQQFLHVRDNPTVRLLLIFSRYRKLIVHKCFTLTYKTAVAPCGLTFDINACVN